MFQQSADTIWSNKIAAYPDRFSNADLAGEQSTVETHIDIELSGGMLVGGYNAKVDLSHDGDDWEITGVEYSSDFGGPSDDFDAPKLREMKPDGSFKDMFRREVLQLIERQYQELADKATVAARAAQ